MEKMKLDIQKFASNGCTVTVKSITQDIVNNKSTITIHGKLTTRGSSYNYGGAYMQPTISNQPIVGSQTASQTLSKKKYSIGPNGTKEDDWTFEVYHNSDGSCPTLTIKIKWYISDSTNGTATLSGGYKPDTIPRASSVSANNGALNQSLTINIDRKNDAFTHTLKYVCGDTEGWIKDINNKVGTSATWIPPLSLANQNQSGDSVSCRIYCQTYNGSTAIGSATYKDITLSIPTMNPIASLDSATDSNSYKNTYGVFIQNKSKIHTVLSGTPQYTTINTYSWQIRKNNSSGTLLASGSTSSIDYTPTEGGTLYISGTVKDKRGNSGSTSTTISVAPYFAPKCSLAVSRTNSISASYTATGSGMTIDNTNYTKNEVTYILTRGSTQIASWNGSSLNQSGIDSISDQSYTYTLIAQDTISGVTDTKTVTISTTFTLMNFNSTGYAMAIGKASEATGTSKLLEIAMPTIHSDQIILNTPTDIYSGMSVNSSNRNEATIQYTKSSDTSKSWVAGYGPAGFDGFAIYSHETGQNVFTVDKDGNCEIKSALRTKQAGNVATQTLGTGLQIKEADFSEAPNNGIVLEYSKYSGWGGQLYIPDNSDQGVFYNGWSNGARGTWKKLAFEEDTGFQTLTLETGFEHLSWNNLIYRKRCGIATIMGAVTTTATTTWGKLIANIPSSIIPAREINIACRTDYSQLMKIAITTSGTIIILDMNDGSQLPANQNIFIYATYIV